MNEPETPSPAAEPVPVDLHAELQQLDPRAIGFWRVSGLLGTFLWSVMLAGLAVPFALALDLPFLAPVAIVTVGAALIAALRVLIIPGVRYRVWRYRLGEDQLFLQRGFLVVRRTLIPLVRVQNVDTVQGPVARQFGLWSVVVFTAANAQSIPALSQEQADTLRRSIAELARRAKDED